MLEVGRAAGMPGRHAVGTGGGGQEAEHLN